MRRFSQRNSLVTLNDINITPLLDLAFVLLIIFVITTPLLEQGYPLNLNKGAVADTKIVKEDVKTVEITSTGVYLLNRRKLSIDQLEAELVRDYKANPNTIVFIRADQDGPNKYLYAVIERCQRNGITRFSMRTEPIRK